MSNSSVLLRAISSVLKYMLRGLALTVVAAGTAIGLDAALWVVPSPWLWGSVPHPTFYDLLAILLAFPPFLMAGLLILYRRKTRDKWIRKEADKWLALRRTLSLGAVHQCEKIERRTLWGPAVLVLLLFLFFPETTAIISHIFHGRSATVGPYRIDIPIAWTITYEEPSLLSVLYAKGIGREGFGPYWRQEQLQLMGFRAISSDRRAEADWYFKDAEIVSTRKLQIRNQVLTCYEVLRYRYPMGEIVGPARINLECLTQ
ncbi:MAG: hypothetical protein ACRD8A_06370, partial [Candidatus Acidiferrales bacterium]